MNAFLVTYYKDPFYEVEEERAIVLEESAIKPIVTNIKISNPVGFLHIFVEKFEVGVLTKNPNNGIFEFEYKREKHEKTWRR